MDARHSDCHEIRQEGAALKPSSLRVDAIAVVIVFGLAAAVGTAYVRAVFEAGGTPRFYQEEFGPAVMSACGRGYVNPDVNALPALKAFLNLERDSFECSALGAIATRPFSPMQVAFRYQEMTIALAWRWTGVSWSGLAPLHGVIFGLTTIAAYALFRTSVSPLASTLGSVALISSTTQLIYLAHFRDYSKAPFLIAAAAALAWLARVRVSSRALIGAGVVYGLLIGIGVGFRNDLLIALPPFIAVMLCFLPGGVRERVPVKLTAIAACLVAVWLAMWPMRAIYAPGGGNSMQHVVVLGLGDRFNADLGVSNDGLYSWGHMFTDDYAHAQISAYATRMGGATSALPLYGTDYDRSATQLLTSLATAFPGDMVTRVYAAVIRTLALPYNATSRNVPTLVTHPTIVRGYSLRDRILRALGAVWPWLIGAALAGLSLINIRLALFAATTAFYFAAYPVLQFNERHFFHLEVIGWWALLLAGESAVRLAVMMARPSQRAAWLDNLRGRPWAPRVRTAAIVWCAALVLAILPLWTLRAYQADRVRALLASYIALDKEPIDRTTVERGDGFVRIAADLAPAPLDASGDAVHTTYLLAEFAAGACESLKFDVIVRYNSSSSSSDFTRTIQVRPPLEHGMRRIFSAIYSHPQGSPILEGSYWLAGLDLPRESAACLSGLYRVKSVSGLPLVLDVNLPSDWEHRTPFNTLDGIESRRAGDWSPDLYTFPPELPVARSLVLRPVQPLSALDIEQRSATLETDAEHWRVDGSGGVGGRGPFLYLAKMKAKPARAGEMLLARGRLETGGFSLGLVSDGVWVAQVAVLTPGDFVVVIRVPADGEYSVVLANNLPGRSLHNQMTIERIGWVNGA